MVVEVTPGRLLTSKPAVPGVWPGGHLLRSNASWTLP